MKKLSQYLTIATLGVIFAGAFSVPTARALTVYSQPVDYSSSVSASGVWQLVGDFVLSTSVTFSSSTAYYGQAMFSTRNSGTATNPTIYIATSSQISCVGQSSCPGGFVGSLTATGVSLTAGTGFTQLPLIINAPLTLSAGQYYFVMSSIIDNPTGMEIATDPYARFFGFLNSELYGFTFDAGSVGLSDFGISTSSQQEYCAQNLATSTGLLDSIGASFAQGICNVGVFLFIPNTSVVSQWATLASTTEGKIPFSYYFSIRDIINGSAASTTSNFTGFSIDFTGTGVGSTSPLGLVAIFGGTKDLLSTTTIMQYVNTPIYNLLYALVVAAIWIGVLMHLYHRIRPSHATKV